MARLQASAARKRGVAIAVVEAQAAGLPTILIAQVSADAGADQWANAVIRQASRRETGLAGRVLDEMERSALNVDVNMKALAALYRNSPATGN